MRSIVRGKFRINDIVKVHIENNIKWYAIVTIIFVIGIIIGTIVVNNIDVKQEELVSDYLNNAVNNLKNIEEIDYVSLLKKSISSNLWLAIIIYIAGCTVIGIPIVYGTILYKGFSFGFTMACLSATFGSGEGIIIGLSSLFLQNIVIIPTIIAISVSGIKLYKSIMKNRIKENIKMEILRHSAFSAMCMVCMVLASFVETYISSNLLIKIVKFFVII